MNNENKNMINKNVSFGEIYWVLIAFQNVFNYQRKSVNNIDYINKYENTLQ